MGKLARIVPVSYPLELGEEVVCVVAAKKRKPNWIAIRAEYEAGGISQRALAEKFNVPYPTLRDRAKRESWAEAKEETRSKIVAETSQKIVDTLSTEAAQATINHRRLWGLMLDEAEKRLSQKDPLINPLTGALIEDKLGNPLLEPHVKDVRHLKALAEVFKLGTEGERLALGMVDPNKAKEAVGGANAGGMPTASDDAARGIRDAMRGLHGRGTAPRSEGEMRD